VAACHSWLNRNRGLLIRWSKKDENHLAFLMLASGLIAFKKARNATGKWPRQGPNGIGPKLRSRPFTLGRGTPDWPSSLGSLPGRE
jgi:hypothetical protein